MRHELTVYISQLLIRLMYPFAHILYIYVCIYGYCIYTKLSNHSSSVWKLNWNLNKKKKKKSNKRQIMHIFFLIILSLILILLLPFSFNVLRAFLFSPITMKKHKILFCSFHILKPSLCINITEKHKYIFRKWIYNWLFNDNYMHIYFHTVVYSIKKNNK